MFKKQICFTAIFLLNCQITDPNYKLRNFENEDYTGFISRDFFQVVVEVPLEITDKSILQQREICKLQAIQKRNEITLPILRKIASSNFQNQNREREFSQSKTQEELPSFEAKQKLKEKSKTYEGEFAWFFEKFFLYKEDFSQKDKCKFIYRNIAENLYKKVENTKLLFPEPIESPASSPTPALPNPNTPMVPTGGNIR